MREALDARVQHLVDQGLARRQGQRVVFARALLDTLQRRELETAGARLSSTTGLSYYPTGEGETVAGMYRERLNLASGGFAMIDDGLGFSLVPWTPSLERHLGQLRIARAGAIDWAFARRGSPTSGEPG